MKIPGPLPLLLLVATGALLAGCESFHSMRESVKDRIVGAPPRVRVVNGDEQQVFAAAKLAMTRLGYDFVRGGPAQGLLEGLSRIDSGATIRSSRQRSITINLQPGTEGTVEVQVWIKEIEQSDFDRASNPASEVPLRDSAAFDVFFETLQQAMQGAAGK